MSDSWQETMTIAQGLRRELHTHPELSWQEVNTAERIREYLTNLQIPWRACAKTGTVATLGPANKRSADTPHIALRGDMDALPLQEQTDLSWASCHAGRMHACGHDGHTATLLAAARCLKQQEKHLPGPVTLLFQPAEEGGHGAREMIADGALESVDCIYGWHNWPAIGFGKLVCPDGLVMCGNGTFTLTIHGRGGHASQPEQCADPVLAASAITLALQQIISRRLPPQQTAVISVTSIDARSGATIIPEQAIVSGSIRIPNDALRKQINQLITNISQSTAQAWGVECEVTHTPRYPATVNHSMPAQTIRQGWAQLFGSDRLDTQLSLPVMASEDFSYYLREIPGAFALIGSDDGERRHQVPCHSPHYDFNDRLIPLVTQLFLHLAGVQSPR